MVIFVTLQEIAFINEWIDTKAVFEICHSVCQIAVWGVLKGSGRWKVKLLRRTR